MILEGPAGVLFTSSKSVWQMQLRLCVFGVESSAVLYIWRLQEYASGLDQSSFVTSDYLIGIGFGCRVLRMFPRVDYWSSFVACDCLIGVAFVSIMLCMLPKVE